MLTSFAATGRVVEVVWPPAARAAVTLLLLGQRAAQGPESQRVRPVLVEDGEGVPG